MRILHVIWTAQYGGAETMLVDILNYQTGFHDVSLLIINDSVDDSLIRDFDTKIKITRINRPLGSRNPWYLLCLNWKLLFGGFDFIHFHQDDIIRYIPIYRLKNNFCLTIHSVEMDVASLPKYDYLFAVSDLVRNILKNEYNLDSFLVVNGVSLKQIKPRDTVPISCEKSRIVQISRLEYNNKGQDILLKALRKLLDDYHYSQFELEFIGSGTSEDYLKKMCSDLNLDSWVTFLGVRPKQYIQQHLCDSDLLIQPSRWEGFGLTPIEAMAAKVPVIVSDTDGLRTNALKGKNALIFKTGNVDDCAAVLYHALTCSEQEKSHRIEHAYSYVYQHFDVRRTAQDYLDQYEIILKKKH